MKKTILLILSFMTISCFAGASSSIDTGGEVIPSVRGELTKGGTPFLPALAGTLATGNFFSKDETGERIVPQKFPNYEVPPLTKVKIPRIKEGEESYLFVEYAPRKERIIPRHKKRPLGKRKQKGQPQKDRFHFQRQPVKGKRR